MSQECRIGLIALACCNGFAAGYTCTMEQADIIIPADYPELRMLVWNRDPQVGISGEQVLAIYERNWRLVDVDKMDPAERQLIKTLADRYGGSHLLI